MKKIINGTVKHSFRHVTFTIMIIHLLQYKYIYLFVNFRCFSSNLHHWTSGFCSVLFHFHSVQALQPIRGLESNYTELCCPIKTVNALQRCLQSPLLAIITGFWPITGLNAISKRICPIRCGILTSVDCRK